MKKVLSLLLLKSLLCFISQSLFIDLEKQTKSSYQQWLSVQKEFFPIDYCSNGTILIDPYWVLTFGRHASFRENDNEDKYLLFNIDGNIYKRFIEDSLVCPFFNSFNIDTITGWNKEWKGLKLYRLKEPIILNDYPNRLRSLENEVDKIATVICQSIDSNHQLNSEIGEIKYKFDSNFLGIYTPHDLEKKEIPYYHAKINSPKDNGGAVFVAQSKKSYLLGLISRPFDENAYRESGSERGHIYDQQMYIDRVFGDSNSWIDYTILSQAINKNSPNQLIYRNTEELFKSRSDLSQFYNCVREARKKFFSHSDTINNVFVSQLNEKRYSILAPSNEAWNKMPVELKNELFDNPCFLLSFIRGHIIIDDQSLVNGNELVPCSKSHQIPLQIVKNISSKDKQSLVGNSIVQEFGYSQEEKAKMSLKDRMNAPTLRERIIGVTELIKTEIADIYVIDTSIIHLPDIEFLNKQELKLNIKLLNEI